jgi:uracil-DNA glycosylase
MESSLDRFIHRNKDCSKCPQLTSNRTQIVFGAGKKCRVMIIGEAPGFNEDRLGEPFVGRSGQVLNELLKTIGLSRDDVYITNTVLCRPPNNRNPSGTELENCRGRLDEHIEIIDPKVIITLGNFSTQYILKTKDGISSLRGKVFNVDKRKIVPMFHPAVLLYSGMSPEKKTLMEEDFKVVKQVLDTKELVF